MEHSTRERRDRWQHVDFRKESYTWGISKEGTARRLRELRKLYHYSQDDLAEFFYRAGAEISKQAISKWEKGTTLPTLDNLAVLVYGVYGIRFEDILVRYGDQERAESEDQPVPPVYGQHICKAIHIIAEEIAMEADVYIVAA